MQTPFRSRLGGARPSLRDQQNINTASSPNLLAASTAIARKASLNALTGGSAPPTPGSASMAGGDGRDIDVGDLVDVPGGMYGTVKFVGAVRGKKGNFAGVELAKEFAARGKNDGDVDGYVGASMLHRCCFPSCRRRHASNANTSFLTESGTSRHLCQALAFSYPSIAPRAGRPLHPIPHSLPLQLHPHSTTSAATLPLLQRLFPNSHSLLDQVYDL